MASKETQRAQATELLAAHLLETGLAQASLRQLAAAAGISDRMLLYYFESKTDALMAALGHVAGELTAMLDTAVPAGEALAPAELLGVTASLTRDAGTKPFFRLWTEVVAAAARGEAPYTAIAQAIAAGFLGWIEARLEGGSPEARRATAAMILAMVDGLALLEICTDAETATRAGVQMGRLLHPDF
jgi:AcrR family transcriptional regulator